MVLSGCYTPDKLHLCGCGAVLVGSEPCAMVLSGCYTPDKLYLCGEIRVVGGSLGRF